MSGEDEGVLARWARRKRESQVAEAPDSGPTGEAGTPVAAPAPPAQAPEAALPEEEPQLTEADLPDIEALSYESDFSVFMKRNVPLALQKRALRKLWVSNPVLANLDGLNDHDLDYTIAEMKEIAAQSAADLASGVKRLNVMDLRAKEREMRRAAAAQPQPQPRPVERHGAPQPVEEQKAAPEPPAPGQKDAAADLAGFVAPPSRRLDS